MAGQKGVGNMTAWQIYVYQAPTTGTPMGTSLWVQRRAYLNLYTHRLDAVPYR